MQRTIGRAISRAALAVLLMLATGTLAAQEFARREKLRAHFERFTRVSPDEIHYEMTFDDPDTWTKPWTAMIRLKQTQAKLYECACHEGNELIMQTILWAI